MKRYANPPENRRGRKGIVHRTFVRLGASLARNPLAVGGATAFLVAFAFVSANALWYQPQLHPNAFLSTRDLPSASEAEPVIPSARPQTQAPQAPANEMTASIPRQDAAPSVVSGASTSVRGVQSVLDDLGLYEGDVDGLSGPRTRAAVERYRRIVGLPDGSAIDAALLRQLGLVDEPEMAASDAPLPASRPRPEGDEELRTASLSRPSASHDAGTDIAVRRVQAGLRAFGHDSVQIDGVMGSGTREAVREFQSLFGLPVTGELDAELLAKMREIGLTN